VVLCIVICDKHLNPPFIVGKLVETFQQALQTGGAPERGNANRNVAHIASQHARRRQQKD
jgi:hypothetical protein